MEGFICDDPVGTAAANAASCVNQDIVDKVRIRALEAIGRRFDVSRS
jgi:hypothetical protein